MFVHIRGQLIQASPLHAVVEVDGIGYKIYISANAFGKLPQIGSEVFLHLSFIVRELAHTLYGFLSPSERDIFEVLLGVTGIGPKIALSLIGHLSPHDLQKAVSNNDIVGVCRVPGIGKKTAERLMIELRDKLVDIATLPRDPSDLVTAHLSDPNAQKVRDAMSALINLGYNQITAQKAIKKTLSDLSEETDLAVLIMGALKNV